tara:strand:- start:2643 stop:2957 length:315 start_codon:yes stop_codon:yes gene_type:complete
MKIRLSKLSTYKLELITKYLVENWSTNTKNQFLKRLQVCFKSVSKNPTAFPRSSSRPDIRKVVITKQTTAYFKIESDSIYVITIFDTRQDPEKIDLELRDNFDL